MKKNKSLVLLTFAFPLHLLCLLVSVLFLFLPATSYAFTDHEKSAVLAEDKASKVSNKYSSLKSAANEKLIGFKQRTDFFPSNLTIYFADVLEDSRCPKNVKCIWAGNAKVLLEVFNREGAKSVVQLNTNRKGGPQWVDHGNYEIYLSGVYPYPEEGKTINKSDYDILLRIGKKNEK